MGYEDTRLGRPGALIEAPLDTARTVVDMLYAGVFRRYQNFNVILAHGGGVLPTLAGRLDTLGPWPLGWADNPQHVTTAEMAQAYKPSQAIFALALDRLALDAADVLHCSLASWADIDGAKPLGMAVAWINRGADTLGTWQPRPDFEFDTLSPVRDVLESLPFTATGEAI